MLGLDATALFVGFAAGVVLWGGLSFGIEWVMRKIKARNTPDYEGEIARLNGRILELESAVQDTASGAEFQLSELQASNDALRAELAEREQDTEHTHHLQEHMADLESRAARVSEAEAALSEMTTRAEAAERSLQDAKTTLIAAEKALRAVEEKSRTSLLELRGQQSQRAEPGNDTNPAPATTAEMLAANTAGSYAPAEEDADAPAPA